MRDVDGRIDLGLCIRRRRVGWVRINRRRVKRSEDNWCWTEEPSVCTFNGRWLFSSKITSKCIAVLTQQLKHKKVNEMRSYKKWVRIKRRQQVERSRRRERLVRIERRTRVEENRSEEWKHWQYSAENPTVCTFNGRWLFSSKVNSKCVAKLTQQLKHEDVKTRKLVRMERSDWF